MSIVNLLEVKRQKEKAAKKEASRRAKYVYRFLRSTVHRAIQSHHCDFCIYEIMAGEEYEKFLYRNQFKFRTKRKHHPECYGPSEEDIYEIEKELDEDREREQNESHREAA